MYKNCPEHPDIERVLRTGDEEEVYLIEKEEEYDEGVGETLSEGSLFLVKK